MTTVSEYGIKQKTQLAYLSAELVCFDAESIGINDYVITLYDMSTMMK